MFVVWWPKQLLLELEIALKKVGHCIEVLIVLAWRRSLWKLPWMHPHAKRCIFVHRWSTNMMTTSPIYEIAGCVLVLQAKARCPKWAFLPKCPRFAHCVGHILRGKGGLLESCESEILRQGDPQMAEVLFLQTGGVLFTRHHLVGQGWSICEEKSWLFCLKAMCQYWYDKPISRIRK